MKTEQSHMADDFRVYQPSTLFTIGFGVIFPAVSILVAMYIFWEQGGFAALDSRVVFYVLIPFLVYFSIRQSIGYRVTLAPNMIKVTTLFGTRRMLKNEIEFYEYGGEARRLYCTQRMQIQKM